MPRKLTALLHEPVLDETPAELQYDDMLEDLSVEALQRRPLYDYRGKTARQVRARVQEVRRLVRRCLHLPARSVPGKPLRVAERKPVQFEGFSIRPVLIERSRGWYVTAHLYVPDSLQRPAPAVMHLHGHAYDGKFNQNYMRLCRGLARRGFVVLFVDFP
jgi:acetyl esterase/lipase